MEILIQDAVNNFLSLNGNKPVRIITHNDADGLTSGAILSKALIREKRKFVINSVKLLDEEIIKNIFQESYETFIFTDLGSGYLKLIKKFYNGKRIFIFDHHELDEYSSDNFDGNLMHVNPKLINENDYNYCSGAGVVYSFVKNLNKENIDLAYLALIGALGDLQDINNGINKIILEDSIKSKKIEIKKGLKLFGYRSRAIHKILQYSDDPFIPGVSGDENGAINFLNDLGINILDSNTYRKLTDLSKDEMQKLVAGIIIRRIGIEDSPEDVIGDLYLLKDEEDDSIIKDAREFCTMLNCCGKLDSFGIGIGLCFGKKDVKIKAEELLKGYRLEIINALNYVFSNKDKFVKGENFIIINVKDNVRENVISSVMSILSKNSNFSNMILIGMAYKDDVIKISARINGDLDIDLRDLLIQIASDYGMVGGHKRACGALINKDKEDFFIERTINILNKAEIKQR